MTRDELARLVLNMRVLQREFLDHLRSRASGEEKCATLRDIRRVMLERQVDLAVEECLSQSTLFGDEDEGRLQ